MKKINFTHEQLEKYFENRFHDDLKTLFDIKNEDGIEVLSQRKRSGRFSSAAVAVIQAEAIRAVVEKMLHKPTETQLPQKETSDDIHIIREEDNLLFVVWCLYMSVIEDKLSLIAENADSKKLVSCLNDFGFPSLFSVSGDYTSRDFLNEILLYKIRIKNDIDALIEANSVAEPFILYKFISFLITWENSSFLKNRDLIPNFISDVKAAIKEILFLKYRKLNWYVGLTGVDYSLKNIAEYYKTRFLPKLKEYFNKFKENKESLEILDVSKKSSLWYNNDDKLVGNVSDNMLFAGMMLYMVLAEQSILEYAKESINDFHESSGWPMISSGSEAGCYLHPLMMLEEAGLSPMKCDIPLFMQFVKNVFFFLRQEMNSILNGHNKMKDEEAGQRFLKVIRSGRVKPQINKYLDAEEKSIQDLLNKWVTSSCNRWRELLLSEGVRIQREVE